MEALDPDNHSRYIIPLHYHHKMSIITYGQGLTNPRHLAFHSDCLYFVEDSTKELWCLAQKEQQPCKRIAGGFTNPNGIAFSKEGELLVTDYTQGNVIKIVDSPSGHQEPTVVISKLNNPYGIAVDTQGNIVVADAGNEAVKVFSPDDYSQKNEFKLRFRPVDIAIQNLKTGRLVVVSYSGELVILDPDTGDELHHQPPVCPPNSKYYGTTVGLAVDSDDRIYVTQHLHKQLIEFDPDLNFIGPVDGLPDLTMAWAFSREDYRDLTIYTTPWKNLSAQSYVAFRKMPLQALHGLCLIQSRLRWTIKERPRRLALAMALHPRLGVECGLGSLGVDIVSRLCRDCDV